MGHLNLTNMTLELLLNHTNHTHLSKEVFKLGEDLLILMRIVPLLVPILFSLIIITGFIGNLLVVCVVCFNKNMRNMTNLLILNLAVSKMFFFFFFYNYFFLKLFV